MQLFSGLLPPQIAFHEMDPRTCYDELFPGELQYIRRASLKRRREFAAGRRCARKALMKINVSPVPILVGPDRAPVWPVGIIGSISHTDDWCCAAVTRRSSMLGIGVDIEHLGGLNETLLKYVCTDSEEDMLQLYPEKKRYELASLIFSAKESLYKCLHPLVMEWIDFHDVQIFVFPSENSFKAVINRPLCGFPAGSIFPGLYNLSHGYICTAVMLMQ